MLKLIKIKIKSKILRKKDSNVEMHICEHVNNKKKYLLLSISNNFANGRLLRKLAHPISRRRGCRIEVHQVTTWSLDLNPNGSILTIKKISNIFTWNWLKQVDNHFGIIFVLGVKYPKHSKWNVLSGKNLKPCNRLLIVLILNIIFGLERFPKELSA